MATTNNVQGYEPPRPTTLERQVQNLMAAVEHLTKQNHDWRNNYVKEMQDTMFKRKTRKTVQNGRNKRGQRVVMHRADQSGGT